MEEVALLWEEMRRAVDYTRHLAHIWRARARERVEGTPAVLEGLAAYAEAKAAAEDSLARQWEEKWAPVRHRAEEFLLTTDLAPICSFYSHTQLDTDMDDALSQPRSPPSRVEIAIEDPMEDDDEWD